MNVPCYEDGGNCIVNAQYPEPGVAKGVLRAGHGALALKRAAALKRSMAALE